MFFHDCSLLFWFFVASFVFGLCLGPCSLVGRRSLRGQGVGVKITGWRRSFVGGFTSLIASIDRNKADFNLSASDRAALLS